MLLGWNAPSKSIDSGVPEAVRAVLAGALTSIARVSFPVSEVPRRISKTEMNSDEDQVRLLGTGGPIERAAARLKRMPSSITLLSTRSQKTAAKLFEDAGYPWRLQGQVALLSAPDAAPPEVDRQTLLSLMSDDWATHGVQLRSIGVVGVLRPGVDGDVAGVLSLTREFKKILLEALAHQAKLENFDWLLLDEKNFVDKL